MSKISVTPISTRARFKQGKKNYLFGDTFEVEEKDKRIQAAIKARVLKKVASIPDPVKKTTEPVSSKK